MVFPPSFLIRDLGIAHEELLKQISMLIYHCKRYRHSSVNSGGGSVNVEQFRGIRATEIIKV